MNSLKLVITVFLLTVVVMCGLGIAWWNTPPEPLAHYQTGGRAILALTAAGCLYGAWSLWTGDRKVHRHER